MKPFNQAWEHKHTSHSLVTKPEYYSFVVVGGVVFFCVSEHSVSNFLTEVICANIKHEQWHNKFSRDQTVFEQSEYQSILRSKWVGTNVSQRGVEQICKVSWNQKNFRNLCAKFNFYFFSPFFLSFFLMKVTCPQQHRPPPVTALGLSRKSLNLKEGFPSPTKLRIMKTFWLSGSCHPLKCLAQCRCYTQLDNAAPMNIKYS